MAQRTPEQQHKRQFRLQIILPIMGLLLLMVLMLVLLVLIVNPTQLSQATDFIMIIFCLTPAVILCLVPSLGLVAAALWVALSAGQAQPPLAKGRLAAVNNLGKVQQFMPRIAQPLIAALAKLTTWENMLGISRSTGEAEEKSNNER